jgi:monoamine oxidase
VFIAGEATSQGSGGTVEGALESAERAVKGVLHAR